jgi:hypothetical protein
MDKNQQQVQTRNVTGDESGFLFLSSRSALLFCRKDFIHRRQRALH